jgi:hypothetical protein
LALEGITNYFTEAVYFLYEVCSCMPKERMGKEGKRGPCTDMVFSKGIMLNHCQLKL